MALVWLTPARLCASGLSGGGSCAGTVEASSAATMPSRKQVGGMRFIIP